MGQKVNPNGMRIDIIEGKRHANWFAPGKNYSKYLQIDQKIRDEIMKRLPNAAISSIDIERQANRPKVIINSAKPGVIHGRRGAGTEELHKGLSQMVGEPVRLQVVEVRKPELIAVLVAESIAQQLERRIMFRRAMKRAVQTAMKAGALGIKVSVGGRLGGAEIARTEGYREGRIPLHTFRADVDYGIARANTTYGVIGVKVWIFKGEVFSSKEKQMTNVEQKQAEE